MAKEGWVSLHRKIQEHWIWQDANKFKWWVDILLTVNNAPAKVNIGNEIFECSRGESLLSLKSWSERWGVSKDTTRNFMTLLERDKMITRVNCTKTTRLTVCNYDSYQTTLHVKQTRAERVPSANQTQGHPNNNDNNKDNKIKGTPYADFLKLFNTVSGKTMRVLDDKTKGQLNARYEEGFTDMDFTEAIKNCKADEYHIKNPKFLTPEFITRADKLQKYLGAHTEAPVLDIFQHAIGTSR